MIQIHNKRGINSTRKIEVIQQQDIINLLKPRTDVSFFCLPGKSLFLCNKSKEI